MGIDWETLLGVEGAALGTAYEEYVAASCSDEGVGSYLYRSRYCDIDEFPSYLYEPYDEPYDSECGSDEEESDDCDTDE